MTELHLYFAQCLKTLSKEFTTELTSYRLQLNKLLSAWENADEQTQRSLKSLEQRVATLELKNRQDPPETPTL